ncbi:MAG: LLM class F420-dependent oxidoreductase [Chloroflexi bacterium RIFCSPLOWO2_12_FULL_71_12]|nr:MAG: LLM class F420-dependent oxidoreductase [Chloroflexi bacterium RIFCSPLOWO2_12_FULL_71_12]
MAHPGRAVAERIGRVGVWTFRLDEMTSEAARDAARRFEQMGAGALWIPESVVSKEMFAHSTLLLSWTERLPVAPGIANIWARDPVAMANGARTLAEAFPGRFVLGLGVSHEPAVRRRGGVYERPLAHMRTYLEAMDRARSSGPEPAEPAPRVLAALGPKMLELAAERTAGAHPYFVPVEHTPFARSALGPDPLLAVEQAVVFETDPSAAREIARDHMKGYLRLDNYANNLRRLGWGEDDITGPSDRLVDAIVAWGRQDAIADRVRAHLDGGADHVCVQPLARSGETVPFERLADLIAAVRSVAPLMRA